MTVTILQGDCRDVMPTLPDRSVQCCITSPPYWQLRDYMCDGQMGRELTPEAYATSLVGVFQEVKRVLRDDGTCWIVLGDSYASGGSGTDPYRRTSSGKMMPPQGHAPITAGLKPKDLVGIPWMVAFALRADGWYLRSDIIWSKINGMPESVTDRPTNTHEYIFLLSKRDRYFYDQDSIREPHARLWDTRNGGNLADEGHKKNGRIATKNTHPNGYPMPHPDGRNRRSVWPIATTSFHGAHFAVFPPKLIEPCVLAGTSPQACEHCSAPWKRVVEQGPPSESSSRPQARRAAQLWAESELTDDHLQAIRAVGLTNDPKAKITMHGYGANRPEVQRLFDEAKEVLGSYYREFLSGGAGTTTHWQSTCACENSGSARCVVLDPFGGSGTTGMVAESLGRDSILIELNEEYIKLQEERTNNVQVRLL